MGSLLLYGLGSAVATFTFLFDIWPLPTLPALSAPEWAGGFLHYVFGVFGERGTDFLDALVAFNVAAAVAYVPFFLVKVFLRVFFFKAVGSAVGDMVGVKSQGARMAIGAGTAYVVNKRLKRGGLF
jgi:hypothetical protein